MRWIFDKRVELALIVLTVISVIGALYYGMVVAPDERVMGPVYRIFFFHVGSAIASYFLLAAVLCGSVLFLLSDDWRWDCFAQATSSVTLCFCSVVLCSGMIWGHSAWNTWWRWEPRLVSFLILWLLLAALVGVRALSASGDRQGRFPSILGVFTAVNVPIVVYSVRLLPPAEQLHPQVIANQGLADPRFGIGLAIATVALVLLASLLVLSKLRNLLLAERLYELESQQRL